MSITKQLSKTKPDLRDSFDKIKDTKIVMPTIRMSGLSKNVITNELPAKAHVIKAVAKIGKSENTVPHNKEPVVSIAHRKAGKCFLGELIEDGGAPAIFLEKRKVLSFITNVLISDS